MNNKFLTDVMNNDVMDDLLDESYHVNFDVTVDSDKFNVKVTSKNTENGQYLLYALNNITCALLTKLSEEYEIEKKELLNFLCDSVDALDQKELNGGLALEVVNE